MTSRELPTGPVERKIILPNYLYFKVQNEIDRIRQAQRRAHVPREERISLNKAVVEALGMWVEKKKREP